MTAAPALRAFSIDLPDGIMPVPVTETPNGVQALGATLTTRFGLSAGDTSATVVAELFAAYGELLGGAGMDFAGIGLFRSPDEPDRPASVMLTGTRLASDHESPEIAIAGVHDLHVEQGDDSVQTIHLSAGLAVVVVMEELQTLPTGEGADPVVLLNRRATAWIPDPGGTTMAVVSVMSPSWQDWAHVCDLALDVFDSFAWEEAATGDVPAGA